MGKLIAKIAVLTVALGALIALVIVLLKNKEKVVAAVQNGKEKLAAKKAAKAAAKAAAAEECADECCDCCDVADEADCTACDCPVEEAVACDCCDCVAEEVAETEAVAE